MSLAKALDGLPKKHGAVVSEEKIQVHITASVSCSQNAHTAKILQGHEMTSGLHKRRMLLFLVYVVQVNVAQLCSSFSCCTKAEQGKRVGRPSRTGKSLTCSNSSFRRQSDACFSSSVTSCLSEM